MKKEFQVTNENLTVNTRVAFTNAHGTQESGTIAEINGDEYILNAEGISCRATVKRESILALRLSKLEEHRARHRERSNYGRSSKVNYAHITHRIYGEYEADCEFCVKEAKRSEAQRERQETRQDGRYSEYYECEYHGCSKKVSHAKATVVPADGKEDGNGILEMHARCAEKFLAEMQAKNVQDS